MNKNAACVCLCKGEEEEEENDDDDDDEEEDENSTECTQASTDISKYKHSCTLMYVQVNKLISTSSLKLRE